MPGSPAFYNKVSLWMREGALDIFRLRFNEAFSTASPNIPAPSSGCYSPHNRGRKPGCMSRLSTLGWNHPLGPGGSHRMTLKWELQPPHLGQGCWPKGGTGASPAKEGALQWQARGSNTSGPSGEKVSMNQQVPGCLSWALN